MNIFCRYFGKQLLEEVETKFIEKNDNKTCSVLTVLELYANFDTRLTIRSLLRKRLPNSACGIFSQTNPSN